MNIYPVLMVIEVLLALGGAWCILHEKRLIAFEEKLARRIKAAVRMQMKKRAADKRRRLNTKVRYTPYAPGKVGAQGQEAA